MPADIYKKLYLNYFQECLTTFVDNLKMKKILTSIKLKFIQVGWCVLVEDVSQRVCQYCCPAHEQIGRNSLNQIVCRFNCAASVVRIEIVCLPPSGLGIKSLRTVGPSPGNGKECVFRRSNSVNDDHLTATDEKKTSRRDHQEKKRRRGERETQGGRGREASHKTSEESPTHGHFRSVVGERERQKEVERDSEREGDVRIQEKKKVNLFFLRREQKKMDDRSRPTTTTITSSQSRFPTAIGCFAGGMTSARRR